ncbi:MAG: peptidoglycan DD-metalloendopeptidase family protein [Clostridia bacterium]|nr:peptidoglycan DD-metalloendopeptidase family protein [Clostridia bacterium]
MLQDIFKAILVTSFIGTALTLVLALIKPITKRWFTSSWHYYMWLVVLVVMLLPIRISLPGQIQSVPVLESNSQIAEETVSNVTNEPIQVTKQDLQLNSDKESNTYSRLENLKMFAYDKFNIAAFIWFVSMMVLFLCKLIGYMIFLIKLRKYSDVISCPELMRFTNKKIVTRTSDRISSPLMIGLFKPTLLLPKTEMTPEQLDNVLAHEMTHFKRKDILYKWFICMVKCIHWFNPAIYYINKQVNIECEISCDLAVVKEMSEEQEICYINTILTLLAAGNLRTAALTTGMTSDKKTLKRRFTMIKNRKRMKKSTRIISTILAVALLFTTLFASGVLATTVLGEESNILFIVNGKTIEFDNKPFYENNTVYLPLREVLNKVGIMNHKNSSLEWNDGRIIIKLAYDDEIENYDEQVQGRKIAAYGSEIKTLNYCYAIEIGKAEYILNPEDALPFKSELFKTHFNTKETMKNAPVLRGSTTYVPYEYIDKFLDHNMYGLGPFGVDGPYNITCIVDIGSPVSYVTPCFFWPAENDIDNSVSKGFGVKVNPVTGEEIVHNGVDTIAKENSLVCSAIRGRVTEVGFDDELGNYVVVANDSGVSTLYAHLASVEVKEGDYLHKRANIGRVGKTGTATGAFLHFEIKINGVYYDPMKFWAENPLKDIEVIDNDELLSRADTQNDNGGIEWNNSTKMNADAGSSGSSRATLSIPTQNNTGIKIKSITKSDNSDIVLSYLSLNPEINLTAIEQSLKNSGITISKDSNIDLRKNYSINKCKSGDEFKVLCDNNGNITLYFNTTENDYIDITFTDCETGNVIAEYGVLPDVSRAYSFMGFDESKEYNVHLQEYISNDINYIVY